MIADCQRQPGSGVEAWQPLASSAAATIGRAMLARVEPAGPVRREQALISFSAAVVVRLPATVMSLLPRLSSHDFGMPNIFL